MIVQSLAKIPETFLSDKKREILGKICLGGYFIMYPFHFLGKGQPQVADLFGVVLIALFSGEMIRLMKEKYQPFVLNLSVFILMTFLVNGIYAFIFSDIILIKNSIIYLYAFLLSSTVIYLLLRDSVFVSVMKAVILCSVGLQIGFSFFANDFNEIRTALYFNNPNQLAHWSIAFLTLGTLFFMKNKNVFLGIFLASLFFIVLSTSKAGIISFAFMSLALSLRRVKLLFLLIAVGGGFFLAWKAGMPMEKLPIVKQFALRMDADLITFDDNLMGRGVDRIVTHPQYILYGAGEGRYARFSQYSQELHETFPSVLFCYGIIPFFFFMIVFVKILLKNKPKDLILFLPLIVFSFGHMILRVPLFWICFSLFYFKDYIALNSPIGFYPKQVKGASNN